MTLRDFMKELDQWYASHITAQRQANKNLYVVEPAVNSAHALAILESFKQVPQGSLPE